MIRISRPIPALKIKLVIFDLDGTLIDSERDLAAAVNAMLVKYGRKELPIDVIGTYIGDGAPMLIRRALGDPADREFLQEALNYFLLYYREHKLDSTYIYDGITEALQQIAGSDGATRRMAVLTNKPVRVSRDIVAGLGLSGSFFQVYGGNSFETKKPDPLGANTLMQDAGVAADETVMVGDSQVDILTARNAGMWSVGVTYGFAPRNAAAGGSRCVGGYSGGVGDGAERRGARRTKAWIGFEGARLRPCQPRYSIWIVILSGASAPLYFRRCGCGGRTRSRRTSIGE